MGVTEIAERTWRIESRMGPRNLFQYLLAGADGALLVDTGTSGTPRDAILPAIRRVGVSPDAVHFIVVTHPDHDGVVVVPAAAAAEVVALAEGKARGEDRVRAELERGMPVSEAFRTFGVIQRGDRVSDSTCGLCFPPRTRRPRWSPPSSREGSRGSAPCPR